MIENLNCFKHEELPEKMVVILGDGSGCEINFRVGHWYYNSKNYNVEQKGRDRDWFLDVGFVWFIALPDWFRIEVYKSLPC